jgi:hypothetical protein
VQPVWTTTSIDFKDRQQLHIAVLRAQGHVDFLRCSSTGGCVQRIVYNVVISEIADLSFRMATFIFRELIVKRQSKVLPIIIHAMHRSSAIIRTCAIDLQTLLHTDIGIGVT